MPRIARFGVFEADLESRELRKSGLKVRLSDQPFLVLATLLERPGDIVTREELRLRIWPADTFVDFDHSINAVVNKLREALGDLAESPRYIETVPRRGYRFVCPVEPTRTMVALPPGPPPKRGYRALFISVALAAVLAAGAAGWLFKRLREGPGSVLTAVPLTSYPGSERHPNFSPDGNQVAFSWNGPKQDNLDIYVKMIGSENLLRLTTDPTPEGAPAWSPDGRLIAFMRSGQGGCGVVLVPAIGGPERRLATTRTCGPMSWHPSGKWLAWAEQADDNKTSGIFALSVETGEKRRLTSPSLPENDAIPAFSPDGRKILFARGYWLRDLWVQPLNTDVTPAGQPTKLTSANRFLAGAAWTPDGRDVIYSSNRNGGPDEMWRLSLTAAGRLRQLVWSGGQGAMPAVSPRANRLVFVRRKSGDDIWRIELRDRRLEQSNPVPFLSSTENDHSAQYSPDGQRIVFISARSGTNEVWVCAADGANPVRLTSMETGMTGSPRWSPDGRHVAFDSTKGGNFDVYVIDAGGGRPKQITTARSTEAMASWSRDGRWIYFVSDRSGRFEVWKTLSTGGEAQQMTRNGGYVAFESADGRDLYYSKWLFGSALWRMPAGGGGESQVAEAVLGSAFAPVRDGIYFLRPGSREASPFVGFLEFSTGKVTNVSHVPLPPSYGLSVSPDGRNLLLAMVEDVGSDLMLVEGFR